MRMDEVVSLHDVLKGDQYIKLLRGLKVKADSGIDVGRIKSRIIQSWKSGKKSKVHFESLLGKIDLKLNDLIK